MIRLQVYRHRRVLASIVQESRRATQESAKGGKARGQGGASTPSTPEVDGSAHGTPLHTPKRPPQTPAGRTARHNLPTKRTLDAAEDAEQRDQPQRMHTSPWPFLRECRRCGKDWERQQAQLAID